MTQESAHFVPTDFSDSFFKQFNIDMKIKGEELKKQGKNSTQVNKITEEDMIRVFGVTKDQMQKAADILGKDEKTEKSENLSFCLPKGYGPGNYSNSAEEKDKEVYFIQAGNTKGTTLKIKVNEHVFSSLFDTGAQVSCIKYDTVAALGLLHQVTESSTCIRNANGQDIGVKGSIMVNFKIGPCSFTRKFVVWGGITQPFILGKEFLSHHCFKLGWTDDNKRFAEYRSEIITVASQAVMDDRIMVSHPVRIPARNFAMVPKNASICSQVE